MPEHKNITPLQGSQHVLGHTQGVALGYQTFEAFGLSEPASQHPHFYHATI